MKHKKKVTSPSQMVGTVRDYLSVEEEKEIRLQFEKLKLAPGRQVMWTGVPRQWAQWWADENDLQTLTTAMGPLMQVTDPRCRKKSMSKAQWKRYIAGASRLFAEYIPKSAEVTVLTKPPPQPFRPDGQTTFQRIEEPVLKGQCGNDAVSSICLAHPGIREARNYRYEVWPRDDTDNWMERFQQFPPEKTYKATLKKNPVGSGDTQAGKAKSRKKGSKRSHGAK